ncbi:MAG: EB domain-containing protein [Polyangiales bacterium]
MHRIWGLSLGLLWTAGMPQAAHGQAHGAQVLELNKQAMRAYTELRFAATKKKLRSALALAKKHGVTGEALGRTYLNLAVLHVAGLQDNAKGLDYCKKALQAAPEIQLDPLVSTPEVQTVFNLAQREVADTGAGGPTSAAAPAAPSNLEAAPFDGPGNIPHVPVPEQLTQTAVPVFIEVPDDAPVGPIYLFYKGLGMQGFRRVQMKQVPGGYGFEIPCKDVFEPKVQYYIVAYDNDNKPIGFAGTPQEPVEVPIVARRTHPAPALPGSAPAEQCQLEDCPPGMPGCNAKQSAAPPTTAIPLTCETDDECPDGSHCDDGLCSEVKSAAAGDVPRFFLHLGATWGSGLAQAGMPADAEPDPAPVPGVDSPYVDGGTGKCELEPGNYCVRVVEPGFVPTFAIRAAVGYWILPRLAAALSVRFQPNAGEGILANFQLGGRVQVLLTRPRATGFHISALLGSSIGQIQLQPDQGGADQSPFVISGLNSAEFGAVLGYRFTRNFGLHLTPQAIVLFPTTLFNVDTTLGVEVAF